jgi:Tfp pilus assembly protein PilX
VRRQARGSALVVVLVLMSGLGALALAAAAAAVTALSLAGHQQMAQNAFEAAETGITSALLAAAETRGGGAIEAEILPEIATASASFRAETREAPGPGALPTGFSIGENANTFATRHFFITADGQSGRGARQRLEQGFYFVVPSS